MKRELHFKIGYVVAAVFTYYFLGNYDAQYFSPLARPILGNWKTYTYFLNFWLFVGFVNIFLITDFSSKWLLKWTFVWRKYLFVSVNALLLGNAYFALVLRTYFLSFPMQDILIYGVPIIGVSVLMFLSKFSFAQIIYFNTIVLAAVTPLALQYAIIAPYDGPLPQ